VTDQRRDQQRIVADEREQPQFEQPEDDVGGVDPVADGVRRWVTAATNASTPSNTSTLDPNRSRRWASGKASSRVAAPM
jgi:hypothetical protein